MDKNVKIMIISVTIILLLPKSCNFCLEISFNNSLKKDIMNLTTTPSEPLQGYKYEPLSGIMQQIDIKSAIQSSAIIIEDSDDFSHGTMINLDLDNDLHLSLNLTSIWKQKLNPPIRPSARHGHAMVYDPNTAKIILFGGINDTNLSDTWMYDLVTNTWIEKTPPTSPSGRYLHTMVYDAISKKVLLFGGYYGGGQFGDTWVYDPVTNIWSNKNPSSSPSARYGHSMVYDNVSNKFILFGGRAGTTNYADTWVYDLASNFWTQMSPGTSPGTRFEHSMVFDPISSNTILFGGHAGGTAYLDDTWVYDLVANTWTDMNPEVKPNARRSFDMIYNCYSNKALLYGGYSNAGYFQDTWIYDPATNIWTEETSSYSPGRRFYHAMTYDSKHSKVILFGGLDSSSIFNDMWIYSFSGYYQSGYFQSKLKSLGSIYHITGDITWNPTNQPINTSLKIQIGLSNTTNDMDFQFMEKSTSPFSFGGLAQYLRYRVFFEPDLSQISSPRLSAVYIYYVLEKPTPIVQIIDPQNNSIVNGEISISALANSPNGIDKVCFYVCGLLLAWDDRAPYSCSWNSTNSVNGLASVIVIATSKLGQDSVDSINIVINNPVDPKVSPPNPPSGLGAVAEDSLVVLNWSPPGDNGGSPIKRYNIYRGTTISDYLSLGMTINPNFSDNTVRKGTTYYYTVTAVNDLGESNLSNIVYVTILGSPEPPTTVPSMPLDLSITSGDNFIVLKWLPPSNDGGLPITRYNIYRGTSSGAYLPVGIVTGNTISFNNTLLVGGVIYYFVVTAVNQNGESAFSNVASATPTGTSIPQSGTSPNIIFYLVFLGVFVGILRRYKKK